LLLEKFGKVYVDEVKKVDKGFVDVPVGQCKESSLQNYPHLCVQGAPSVRFTQSTGCDVCVSKPFASALFAIGFVKGAEIIDDFGETDLAGNVANALQKVHKKAVSVLPSWIQPKRMPLEFVWERELGESTILLAVLSASDGHRNHAITIHGGFIYDANEQTTLPLNQEALDYCVSTASKKCKLIRFRSGVMFRYIGKKPDKVRMMLPLHL
jgi:hypothetical protein